jgi:hypothetical protein
MRLAYFSIDDARNLYKKSKFLKNVHARYTFKRYDRQIKSSVRILNREKPNVTRKERTANEIKVLFLETEIGNENLHKATCEPLIYVFSSRPTIRIGSH